ncbi:ABC transporter permease [Paenibacillus sp. FSL R7-0128]|uniref:ABC transporter permease n=1 Tax=Paenibacillus sp. FSL R7-0128 TaxID=2954529 RepID=UPI0030F54152
MIATNNRKTILNLAMTSLRANRLRNLAAICAIILTTLLITSIFTMALSINQSMQYAQMKTVGSDFHGGFKYLSPEQVETLLKHPSIKQSSLSLNSGILHNKVFDQDRVEVLQVDQNYADHGFIEFVEGGLPAGENEVALNTWVLGKLGVQPELGKEITLQIDTGERIINRKFTLSGYYEADKQLAMAGLAFVSKAFTDKNLSDIDPVQSKESGSYVNTSELSVMFNNSFHIEKKMNRILADTRITAPIGINWAYSSVSLAENVENILPYAAVIFIIMLSGYLLIYNIFYISVVQDVKFYGLLKMIGTTPRQLRRIIAIQARLLYLIALPFGLGSGYMTGRWATPLTTSLSGEVKGNSLSSSPWIFAGAALFSFLTVWIAAHKPGRLAADIAPVEAVKFSGVQNSGKRTLKPSRHGARLYRMSFSNLFRSKKKLSLMLSSLFLSILLFNTIFTVISSMDVNKYLSAYIHGDYMIHNKGIVQQEGERSVNETELSEELCAKLKHLDGVESIDKVYYTLFSYPPDDSVRASAESSATPSALPAKVHTQLYGLDSGWYDLADQDILEGHFNKEQFDSGDYILVAETLTGPGAYTSYYHPGDTISYSGLKRRYEVMAVLKYNAFYAATSQTYFGNGYNAFLPAAELRQATLESGTPADILSLTLNAAPGKLDETGQLIREAIRPLDALQLKSREDYREELSDNIHIFQIIGYGLSLVIALIGLLNYINSVLTGVIARRHEFAVLESIGMTKQQLKRMLVYEGMYTVLLTALLTSTIGVLLTYWTARGITAGMAYMEFRMMWLPFILIIPILAVLSYLITLSAYKPLARSPIVERLREME